MMVEEIINQAKGGLDRLRKLAIHDYDVDFDGSSEQIVAHTRKVQFHLEVIQAHQKEITALTAEVQQEIKQCFRYSNTQYQ